jgi:hypothetical protein
MLRPQRAAWLLCAAGKVALLWARNDSGRGVRVSLIGCRRSERGDLDPYVRTGFCRHYLPASPRSVAGGKLAPASTCLNGQQRIPILLLWRCPIL